MDKVMFISVCALIGFSLGTYEKENKAKVEKTLCEEYRGAKNEH